MQRDFRASSRRAARSNFVAALLVAFAAPRGAISRRRLPAAFWRAARSNFAADAARGVRVPAERSATNIFRLKQI